MRRPELESFVVRTCSLTRPYSAGVEPTGRTLPYSFTETARRLANAPANGAKMPCKSQVSAGARKPLPVVRRGRGFKSLPLRSHNGAPPKRRPARELPSRNSLDELHPVPTRWGGVARVGAADSSPVMRNVPARCCGRTSGASSPRSAVSTRPSPTSAAAFLGCVLRHSVPRRRRSRPGLVATCGAAIRTLSSRSCSSRQRRRSSAYTPAPRTWRSCTTCRIAVPEARLVAAARAYAATENDEGPALRRLPSDAGTL